MQLSPGGKLDSQCRRKGDGWRVFTERERRGENPSNCALCVEVQRERRSANGLLLSAGVGWAAITQQGSMVELESYCMSAHFMAAEFGDNLCVFKRGGRYKLAAMYV